MMSTPPQPNNPQAQLSPDEAKASLGAATRVMGQIIPQPPQNAPQSKMAGQGEAKTPEPTKEPPKEKEPSVEEVKAEMELEMNKKLDDIRKEMRDEQKREMDNVKELITSALAEEDKNEPNKA